MQRTNHESHSTSSSTARVARRLSACAAAVVLTAAWSGGSTATAATVALDNTLNKGRTLSGTAGPLTTTDWNLKVFTVGSSNATISSMVMGLFSYTQATYNITWELYAVDGSNNPDGVALATDTQQRSFTSTGGANSVYATFTTGGTLGSYSMQAGQTYGLLFKSDAVGGSSLSWTRANSNTVYSPGSSGFSFVANRRTTDSGDSYSDSTYYNAWQLNVTPSAVPGAGLAGFAGLATVGRAGISRRRRR